jgi:hypothetical protein
MKNIIIVALVVATLIVGEVKCIVKAFSCNWEPIGKAEAVYTVSALIGVGAIVGYIDIEDK